ncbi:MAG: phosphatidylglycerophosphatase A [Candidatus Omnitrophota bacterium]
MAKSEDNQQVVNILADMVDFAVRVISSCFYLGYLPLIPGTFASLAGVFIFFLVRGSLAAHIILTLILIILGFTVSSRAERIFEKKDARYIVIDEVSGMLISFLFVPFDLRVVIIGFFLFRILDTFKPYPADRIQEFKGSIGVMGDDITAGVYTNIILQVVVRLTSFNIS